jgi:arylsulfatase A-like enzyme
MKGNKMNQKKPNIIFIMIDNHYAKLLGTYGNEEIHTPHLDRMADQGIKFNNAFCTNGMCSPTRSSFLTGLMPSQHGVHSWLDDRIMDRWPENWCAIREFTTLSEILKEKGYKTALIGKWHMGMPFKPQAGFDYWVTFPDGHTRSFYNNTMIENGKEYKYPGHSVDYFSEKAVEYIKAHDPESDSPYFMFLTYNAPYGHWPALKGPAKNRFARLYEKTEMKLVPREGISQKAIDYYNLKKNMSGEGVDYGTLCKLPNDLTTMRNFYSQMSMVDDGVGQVMAALKQNGQDKDTLIFYTADHGFSLGQHGFWGHSEATWPSNTHNVAFNIPLIVRHTDHIAPLQESNLLVSQVDYAATILDYVGLGDFEIPNSPGNSLAPLLKGERLGEWSDAVFMEQEETRAIRTRKWLYMKRYEGSKTYRFEDEMYDLVNDPGEYQNLIADPEYVDVAKELRDRIDAFFEKYSDQKYDLWKGGTAKGNSDRPWLWKDVWGKNWESVTE